MSNKRNSTQKSQFRERLRQRGKSAPGSAKDKRLQFLLVNNNSKTKQIVSQIVFGKYKAAGITRKEALVDGLCLRVHIKRLKENIIQKQLKKKNPVQLKKSQLQKGRKLLRLSAILKSRIQLKSLQSNKRKYRQRVFIKNIRRNFINPQNSIRNSSRKYFGTASAKKQRSKSMSTDSETEKCDPLNIPSKPEDVAFDEVKSFLPIDDPACSESNEKESDADPLGYENDPLLSDNEVHQIIEESKAATEKLNGQTTPLRTYAGKRPRKNSSISEIEEIKKPKIDDTDSEDLETLLAGGHNIEEKENKHQVVNGDSSTELEEAKLSEKTSRSHSMNGNVINGCTYTLVCRTGRPGRKRLLKNNLGFEKLVHQLKSIRLPAPNWKIRIFVTRDQQISEITFTNKLPNERCVKFSRSSITYVITFNSKVVTLVGAPTSIDSHTDITHLLEIVNTLSADDPLIEYTSTK